ncbi:T7SS effector LXG polymorphic toxin [Cytobacillus kochii]|uniref:T7SS effector LXG polymorphic toxin n=1 Tax=Cytobacillus kochii TaxID=859143 RepID=UPI002E1BDCD5|nr:T7SS effector LXG polymorphic toxin [Cytobacillus kochii]
MKVLDADELHSGINNTLNGLKHLRNQLETLEMSILSISSLESELRGGGGNSIRAFYKDVHLPFLHSMKQMVEQYEATLKELTQSLRSLDSSSRAMIRQSFIQQDLTQGIRRTENITSDLTEEGNRTIQSVDDIVSLPKLDDHRVHQHAQSATNQMTQTIERLHHFDQKQTNKVEATAQDLSRLKSTISEIQTLFQNGTLSLSTYQPNQLARLLNDPVIGGMSLSQAYGPMALGMMPTYAPFSSMNFSFGGQPIKDVEKNQSTLGWISTGLDFVPVLSNLKAGIEAATGTDFITGREIGNLERAALVAAIFGGPLVKGGIKVVKWGSKLFSKVKNVLNPQKVKTVVDGIFSKVTQGFHALRNTAAELTKKIGEIRIPLPMQNQYAVAGGTSSFGFRSTTIGKMASGTLVRMSSSLRGRVGKNTGEGSKIENISKLTTEDIPTAKSGKFNDFFNSLSSAELDELWKDKKIRKKIERQLREPGGLHEWHLVSRAPQFKFWDISAEKIKDLRTAISDVKFVNPNGVHGGLGSTRAHNELLAIIDTSNDYNTFIRRLNNWAYYRLEGGISSLPEGLRLK